MGYFKDLEKQGRYRAGMLDVPADQKTEQETVPTDSVRGRVHMSPALGFIAMKTTGATFSQLEEAAKAVESPAPEQQMSRMRRLARLFGH